MEQDNSIFIGTKPFMNYVTAVVIQFTTENASEVLIRARGKYISRAADVAEIASKKFLQDQIKVKSVDINTEDFTNNEGKEVQVSTIEIVLEKIKP
jgi:DNA-binding protein